MRIAAPVAGSGAGFGTVAAVATRRGAGGTSRRTSTNSRATSRRPASRSGTARRRTPRTSTTLGSAVALALVALFARSSWPVRLGVIAVAVVAVVAAVVVVRRRRPDAAPTPSEPAPPPSDPKDPPT